MTGKLNGNYNWRVVEVQRLTVFRLYIISSKDFKEVTNMTNFTVIRVHRNDKGECCLCAVERTFDNIDEAEVYASTMNLRYKGTSVSWVIDKY